ncbi:hypothetical protein B0H19DRAFT_1245987 [Mycena capillaripes]|nr:hypothetical protein B0H19DRAFT_1245987 [Mycena capillaripes]
MNIGLAHPGASLTEKQKMDPANALQLKNESTPRLRHRPPIRSRAVSLANTSIDPLFDGPSCHHDDNSSEDGEPTLIGTTHANRSIAPQAPGPRNDVPRSHVTLERPRIVPAPPVPEPSQPNPPPSSSHPTGGAAPIPHLRSDPFTQRAVAAARACYDKAGSILQRLMPCEPLLEVAQSSESCVTLARLSSSMIGSLVIPPAHLDHACASLGLCPYESWHEGHAQRMQKLTECLDAFIADFDPSIAPYNTVTLTEKLARYVELFEKGEASIQRSWIRLESDINGAKIADYSRAIRAMERTLAGMRFDKSALQTRRNVLIEEFKATNDFTRRQN